MGTGDMDYTGTQYSRAYCTCTVDRLQMQSHTGTGIYKYCTYRYRYKYRDSMYSDGYGLIHRCMYSTCTSVLVRLTIVYLGPVEKR